MSSMEPVLEPGEDRRALLARLLRERAAARSYPLSFAQERLWFWEQLEPGSSLYNTAFALRLRGALDVEALRRSIDGIVRRHEVLRSRFTVVDGRPVQVAEAGARAELQVEALDALPEAEREARLASALTQATERPFDLGAAPVIRACLFRLSAREHVLALVLHHIASDAWSLEVLLRELSALYAAEVRGEDAALPSLPIQYGDYAAWQRKRLNGDAAEAPLAYWRERLAGAPALLELPTDRPRGAVRRHRGADHRFTLAPELTARLLALAQREGCTLYMALLAGFQAVLARHSGQDDVVVGAPISYRGRSETQGLIGFFLNTLALRTDLGGDPTFRELLGRVRETALGAYEHQQLPFERVVEELRPERALSSTPLFQAMLALYDAPGAAARLPGLVATTEPIERRIARFDLSLLVEQGGGELRAVLNYDADLFDDAFAQRFAAHFATLLGDAVADPDARLSRLELLRGAERERVLEWGAVRERMGAGRCLHHRFEEQAARTPAAVAVTCEGESLSYAGLEARAECIARHLRGLGVGPEVRVALFLERSVEMVAAVLGVLKAGGCYVPLDPV
ncbi:MAG TPA: condensation domain-containing protein, partial [Longimicrobium sp.]